MKRLPKKNKDNKTDTSSVSKSVPNSIKKIGQTIKKKKAKKRPKDSKSMPTNADSENVARRLKSSTKGMKYPQKYLDFIDWMSSPPKPDEAITQEQFAQEIGVDETTLSRWKEKVGFWEDVYTLRRAWAKGKSTSVLNSLLRTILRGAKAPEAKLWLQYTGELIDQSDINLGVNPELQEALDKFAKLLP